MIKVGIIGATGYAGGELVRILSKHPQAQIVWYGSKSYIGKKYYQVEGKPGVYIRTFRRIGDTYPER